MGFKIDLEICGKSVECEADIEETFNCCDYKGFEVSTLAMILNSSEEDITCITHDDDINKFIIDAYLESVGE